jgi:hypothetical protein
MTVDNDPWRYKAVPSVDDDDSPIRLHVIVSIRESDLPEVLLKLGRH